MSARLVLVDTRPAGRLRKRASAGTHFKTPYRCAWACLTLAIALTSVATAQPSAARQWNDELLDAIRIDFARPTVHARNLFHTSIAMWDAWAAYDPDAVNYLHQEKAAAADIEAARSEAISYAAFRILTVRFANSPGAAESLPSFEARMAELGYDTSFTDTEGDSPAALGNRIAAAVLEFGANDGSNEQNGYANQFYEPLNPPLLPALPGNPDLIDPNRWQPLVLDFFIDQGGNPIPTGVPPFLGAEWGQVIPFALSPEDLTIYEREGHQYWVYHDPGAPAMFNGLGDAEYRAAFEQVLEWSSELDPADGVMIDISPNSRGNNTLGTNDGSGHAVNPATGQPYVPQIVAAGDYYRVLAEFWADGPASETPPGHWFTIANYVSDHPAVVKRFGGTGPVLSDLEWDVKLYLALGGAVHDAAVAAWGAKGWYDFIRPISALRFMGDNGQRSDPDGPSYDPGGIALVPGRVEVITEETIAEGERHAHLAGLSNKNVGKIAVRAWRGPDYIDDPDTTTAGVGWILLEDWWPYQRPTFVTPPFAGYVSGHSTFSRAASELMTLFTGDPFFPGGLGEFQAPKNEFLVFEDGPSEDVTLQWATYRDASDETSISRIYGGIHPRIDDIPGRFMGYTIGRNAFFHAWSYFAPEEVDSDVDGIPDVVEDAAPNDGDNNNDGVPDSAQAHVGSLPNSETGSYVSLVVDESLTLSSVRTAARPGPLPPSGVAFPIGLFEFTVGGLEEGGATSVDLIVPPDIPFDTFFKFGPTPDQEANHWYEFGLDGPTGSEPIGDGFRLYFVDGGRGDADLVADGKVVDPGGPAQVLSTVSFFPQVVDGRIGSIGFTTSLKLTNTATASMVQVEFFDPVGDPMELTLTGLGTDSRFELLLGRGESVSIESAGAAGLQVGYAQLHFNDGVGGVLVFARTDLTSGVQLFETGVPVSETLTDFSVIVDSIGERDTGLALVYPPTDDDAPDATVTVRLYDNDFTLIAQRTLDPLPAGSHQARFVAELFEDDAVKALAAEMQGILTVESDRPLAAVTLRQTEPAVGFPVGVPSLTTFPVIEGRPEP